VADDIQEEVENKTEVRNPGLVKKNLLLISIISIIMLFAGLVSAYLVLQGGNSFWVILDPPQSFVYSTVAIVLSSAFLMLSKKLLIKGNQKGAITSITATFILGIAFCFLQYGGWKELKESGNWFVGNNMINGSYPLVLDGDFGEDGQLALSVTSHKFFAFERILQQPRAKRRIYQTIFTY